jgi:hypothetical protein
MNMQLSARRHHGFVRAIGLMALLLACIAHADAPRLGMTVFADNRDGDSPLEIFSAETAEIFLRAQLLDVPKDSELTATWFAEQTDAGKPNYQINLSTMTVQADTAFAIFSTPKPGTGWPLGSYRVDLQLDGRPLQQLHFKISKNP